MDKIMQVYVAHNLSLKQKRKRGRKSISLSRREYMWELDLTDKILTLLSNRSFPFNGMSREKNKENDEVSSPKKKK